MIPKTIHWCWFGRGEKTELISRCVESWKKYCPDYKIIEWNEDNFDIDSNVYVKEAYKKKKYAFVADYVRLKVLYTYGGIYLDSDVEIIKPLKRDFLKYGGFSGFEAPDRVPTGIMGAEKNFELFNTFLEYYDDRHFVKEDGTVDTTTNVAIITDELLNRGLILNNEFQVIERFALYPREFFCPLEDGTGKMHKTDDTYAIHWFSKTWWDKEDVKKYKRAKVMYKIFGKQVVTKLSQIKNDLLKHK